MIEYSTNALTAYIEADGIWWLFTGPIHQCPPNFPPTARQTHRKSSRGVELCLLSIHRDRNIPPPKREHETISYASMVVLFLPDVEGWVFAILMNHHHHQSPCRCSWLVKPAKHGSHAIHRPDARTRTDVMIPGIAERKRKNHRNEVTAIRFPILIDLSAMILWRYCPRIRDISMANCRLTQSRNTTCVIAHRLTTRSGHTRRLRRKTLNHTHHHHRRNYHICSTLDGIHHILPSASVRHDKRNLVHLPAFTLGTGWPWWHVASYL
ncbi:hypothetical protein FN846DRAFT_390431 [Sphaerosporella brunnea]|uniref:Uncharacterized protein n=1 Tax=Sphaerosporella brunnea TaxID=1250544 RepID=A0A5J5F5L4_9PEZI|nr:hypothetical protein FN846DRAFT_390431 [Sphaerosporella brunnea]